MKRTDGSKIVTFLADPDTLAALERLAADITGGTIGRRKSQAIRKALIEADAQRPRTALKRRNDY